MVSCGKTCLKWPTGQWCFEMKGNVMVCLTGPRTVWPDETMGPFGPQDQRFQLPGNVGFDCHLKGTRLQMMGPVHRTVPDVLSAPSSTERHEFILAQFVNEYQVKISSLTAQRVRKAEHYFSQSAVECSMHSCPELLKKELELFFPVLPASPITVVTVTPKNQKTATEDLQELLDHVSLIGEFNDTFFFIIYGRTCTIGG
uniref:Methylmalonic aciduria and homocystinuria type D homolog, mitochondrial-like n=1 Tax=Sinocyclocheilus grahami TaxID=75366 RepID=A0A672NYN6_SINGR